MTMTSPSDRWSTAEKLACVERELRYRIRVYARLVAQGKLTDRQAGREIAIMRAVVSDYQNLRDAENPELPLETI